MSQPEKPTQVGPYRLGELLGRGGMGEVYRAYDERLSRWVAVKQVRSDKEGRSQARERLRREARAAAGLAHPAIVQIFDVLDVDEGFWIVMELVEGQTLASLVRKGPLEVATMARIGRQIAEGLAHAHESGIVHRDLKVENVMLSTTGHARILDFGLVKDLNDTDRTQTADGAILGTLRAMSPEQAMGWDVDSRSDVFSLGTLLYECLTGVRAFEGSTPLATLQRVATHALKPLEEVNPEVPSALSGLVARLMHKLPESRPSAAEVARRLRKIERRLESLHSQRAEDLALALRQGESVADAEDSAGTTLGDEARDLDTTLAHDSPPEDGSPSGDGSLSTPSSGDQLTARGGKKPLLTAGRGGWAVLSLLILVVLGSWLGPWGRPADIPLPSQTTGDLHLTYLEGLELLDRMEKPGDLDRAVTLFTAMAAEDPESASIHAALAKALLRKYRVTHDQHWLNDALTAAKEAVEKGEYLALAHSGLANVHLELGHFEEARTGYETALRLDPTCADAYQGLAMLHEHSGENDLAEKAYRRALEVRPDNRFLLDALGSLLFKDARLDEARELFTRSIEVAPANATGYANLAGVHFMRGEMEAASAVLQKGLEVRPHSFLYTNLGNVLFYQGRYEESIEPFKQAIDLDYGALKPEMWANLGDAYRWTPGYDEEMKAAYREAVDLIRTSLEKRPDDPEMRSYLAVYLARRGDWSLALAEAKRLEEMGDLSASVRYLLAMAYEQCGEREKALGALAKALEAGFPLSALEREQELDRLRADPSFESLAKRY